MFLLFFDFSPPDYDFGPLGEALLPALEQRKQVDKMDTWRESRARSYSEMDHAEGKDWGSTRCRMFVVFSFPITTFCLRKRFWEIGDHHHSRLQSPRNHREPGSGCGVRQPDLSVSNECIYAPVCDVEPSCWV